MEIWRLARFRPDAGQMVKMETRPVSFLLDSLLIRRQHESSVHCGRVGRCIGNTARIQEQ